MTPTKTKIIPSLIIISFTIGYLLLQGCAPIAKQVAIEVDTAMQDHKDTIIIILDLYARHSDYILAVAHDDIQDLNKKQLSDLRKFTKIAKSKDRTDTQLGDAISLVGRALTPILIPAISKYVPELLQLLLVVGIL